MPVAKTVTDMQTATFDQLVAAQAKILEVNRDLASRLGDVGAKLPSMPMMDEAIEANRSLIDNVFTWSAKLIEANRTFANELMGVWLSPAPAKPAEKPVAASAATK